MKKPTVLSPEAQSRAVLYLRFSSENQREESIEGQRRECLKYAKRSGIEVFGEYVDRAKSHETVECLYFSQRGFVAAGKLPKRDKEPKRV